MQTAFLTVVLALLTMVGPLGIDTYLPSFHAMGSEFGVSQLVVQQTLSVYIGAMALMMLFYGTLSDSFGRKPVMLASLAVFTTTSLVAAFAPSMQALIVIRGLQGLSAGAGMVIARAMVQDRFSGHDAQRMMALITMVFGLAPAIAPLIGGLLQTTLGWRSVFVFLALFGGGLLLAGWRGLPETLPPALRQPFRTGVIARNFGTVLRHARFMQMSMAIALLFSGIGLYVGSAAQFVMGILHQPETAFGWLFFPLVGGLVAGSALASRLSHRVPTPRLIGWGFAISACGVALAVGYNLLWIAATPWAVMPVMVYTFGLALAAPGMTVAALSLFPALRGLAASVQGFVQMMTFAAVTGVAAPLLYDSALKMAIGHAVALAIGIALWLTALPALVATPELPE